MKKILIVLTNQSHYGDRKEATGLWLGEATEFVEEVTKVGYEVDYVSPKGGYVPIDPRSLKYASNSDMSMYEAHDFQSRAISYSLTPSDCQAENYQAIYFTGGHGVMWDFPDHRALQQLTLQIYEGGGYVSSVCHGIAGLLNVSTSDGSYLIQHKKITGFTTIEEWLSGKRSYVPFLNEKVAKERGAIFQKKRAFRSFALQDGQLITGQNPQSARAVAKMLVSNLSKEK